MSQHEEDDNPFRSLLPAISSPVRMLSPSPLVCGARKDRTPQCSRRATTASTPKARLRHDDSQVRFVAVESSPLLGSEAESQALTERQKEVKERQQNEAATMFRDLRSSPICRTRPRSSAAERRSLPSDPPTSGNVDVNWRPSTPIIPKHVEEIEEVVPQSPTPRSKTPLSSLGGLGLGSSPISVHTVDSVNMPIDLPSSPPAPVPRHTNSEQLSLSSPVYESIEDDATGLPQQLSLDSGRPFTPTKRPATLGNAANVGHWTLTSTVEETPESSTRNDRSSLPTSVIAQDERVESPTKHTKSQAQPVVPVTADLPHFSNDTNENTGMPFVVVEDLGQPEDEITATERESVQHKADSPLPKAAGEEVDIQQENYLDDDKEAQMLWAEDETPNSHMSSDTAEQQIASQLEQDIERSISCDEIPIMNVAGGSSSPTDLSTWQPRKRKRSNEDFDTVLGGGKRHAASAPSHNMAELAGSSPALAIDDDAIEDCIVVDTDRSSPLRRPSVIEVRIPSSSQSSQVSDTSTTRRGRGRPRKNPEFKIKLERKRSSSVVTDSHNSCSPGHTDAAPVRKRARSTKTTQSSSILREGANALQPVESDQVSEGAPPNERDHDALDENQNPLALLEEPVADPSLECRPAVQVPLQTDSRAMQGSTTNSAEETCSISGKEGPLTMNLSAETTLGVGSTEAVSALDATRTIATQTSPSPQAPEEGASSSGWMITSLRKILGSLRTATVGRVMERELDDVLFEIRKEVGRAGDRHGQGEQ